MKIKTKLNLGFGFLFVMVILFGAFSLVNVKKISVTAKAILVDNYESLMYTRVMHAIIDENSLPLNEKAETLFKEQLHREQRNVTENGEAVAVKKLQAAFQRVIDPNISAPLKQLALQEVRKQLNSIDELNMNAIVRKNQAAQATVEKATLYIVFSASLCFLILLSFSVNFPGFVANPLKEFSAALKEISKKNYKQRLQFKGHDEFSELASEFNVMAAKLNHWENSNLAEITSEKLRIEAIIEHMQDAIIGVNERNEILFLNKVAGQLLNLNIKETIGLNATEVMNKNDLLKKIVQVDSEEKPLKIYADHKESYFQLERRQILLPGDYLEKGVSQSGGAAGEVYILKNITKYKELDEAKTNFIATVSHELKTPISSIKMSLKLMEDERVGLMNGEQKVLTQNIKEDSDRLLKITSELLDLAQVETGNLELNFVKTDPREIVVYAMDTVRFQAEQRGIELELVSRNNLPQVNVDTEKTAWVLVNFLSNALRYSAEKSRIVVQVIENGPRIEFSVRDFGKGIDEQYQKRLFERYFQVPTDGNNKSGSGLGLSISKDFIEAQGGKIWLESAIGEGSRFCFSLPSSNKV
ncbi:ATP-binding protein [Pedobacter sp.]|uniref:HAMP domain-containing sensor histidine kinase n=1 Tax=Pedobacter sp. TaxID=1411316 RepID=UPI003D7F1AAA